jgi:hexosaminidase
LKKHIELMALAKLNVFHWHISDDDSFPLEILDTKLSDYGAFKASMLYSFEDALELVEYGNKYAIRVIPEFDNPGHARAVGLDPYFREIVLCMNKISPWKITDNLKINGGPPNSVIDPSNDKTYELIGKILDTFRQIFND